MEKIMELVIRIFIITSAFYGTTYIFKNLMELLFEMIRGKND